MTGRELYGMYRDCHGGQTGERLCSFDELPVRHRFVWDSLADDVYTEIATELRETDTQV